MSFEAFGFSEALLRSISDRGYESPSIIQEKAIPPILEGLDVLASSQTGTGKTAAFTLPILERLSQRELKKGIRPIKALILTPTRELAAQVGENIKYYSAHLPIRHTVVYGGVNINPQKSHLRGGVDVLVATPGRLLDLLDQSALSLDELEFFVLDEADRMLDMGFLPSINKVLKLIPEGKQSLLFSATFSDEILELSEELLKDPIAIQANVENSAAKTVLQQVYHLEKAHKTTLLRYLIQEHEWSQILIFTRTKHGADRLCSKLEKKKLSVSSIHGGKSQPQRLKALKNFKLKKIQILVATDLAARGLDIKELPIVVNYDIPNVPEDYIHRIGRSGRAGLKGHALSFVGPDEATFLERIERLIDQKMEILEMPDLPDLPVVSTGVQAPNKKKAKRSGREKVSKENKQNVKPKPKKKKNSAQKTKERQNAKINPLKK